MSDVAELLREFRAKAERDAKFQGKMEEFQKTTERRLSEGNERMGAIEESQRDLSKQLSEKTVCAVHADMMVWRQKKDTQDEVRDDVIGEVKSDVKVIEYKLTTGDVAKIVAIITPLATALATIFVKIIERFS